MMDLRKVAAQYGGAGSGNQCNIPTPGHSKRDLGTSITIKPGAPDGVLVKCHNGNEADALAVKDMLRRDGFLPDRDTRQRANDNQRRDAAAWDYTDADGVLLYRKVRTDKPHGGKTYRFEHPDGRGGWRKGRGDVRPVPYRLPDLIAAPRDALIYMAEGEKQADKLASWGLVATSSKDWQSFDFSGYVRGRTVVILPDNDEEGERIAAAALKAVETAEGRPMILELPGLPPKGDVMDWRGDAGELRALTEAALNPPAETFPIADLSAWATIAPAPKRFAMAGMIPEREVTLFTGPGGTNKSTFGLQLCACSAVGRPMLGVAVQPGPALYVTAEDDDAENHWRLAKIAGAIGTTLEGLAGSLHVVSLRGRLNNELATFEADGRLRTAKAYQVLRATLEATGAKLLVLDNVGHLYVGNENDRGQVTAFVNLLYQLCRELGVTIVLIGHPNKAGDSYSGSTAWLNAVRSQIVLERPQDCHDADARVLTLGKANYARPDQQLAFRWHDFALILDRDLSPSMGAEIAAITAANADNAIFLACLAERTRQCRAVSEKTGRNLAHVVFADMPESKRIGKKRLEAAMDRLFRTGRIERAELWKGPDRKPVFGLQEVRETGAGNGAETRCGNAGNHRAETREEHTLNTTYYGGAAHEAAAPPEPPCERCGGVGCGWCE